MTQERLPIPFPDEVLVAWLDNQLSEAQREQVAQRLQTDEVLAVAGQPRPLVENQANTLILRTLQ